MTRAEAPPPLFAIEAQPVCASCCSSTPSSVHRMRAPDAPKGCPRATAPPLTFTRETSKSNKRMFASGTTAKASWISWKSTEARRARRMARRTAPAGATAKSAGSTPWSAKDRIRARARTPSSRARSALISTTAAAPSFKEDALAAVMVPSSAKIGGRAAMVSSLSLEYSSSVLTTSVLRSRESWSEGLLALMGTTSASIPPRCHASAARR
mmetsp:Transcript_159312/g.487447  ORF Transcript_159312/g.487447 Transcript_159312/m.487447 type:complete len:211 (-) Transcript_159312:161-793(-)